MDMACAIETFVRGFTFTRSFTHPYLAEQIPASTGTMWRMFDAPRKQESRCEEFVAYGVEPCEVDRLTRAHARDRYRICVMRAGDEPDAGIRAAYKALRYRLGSTEAFFVHPLTEIAPAQPPLPIVRVTEMTYANLLAKAAGRRQMLPEHLTTEPAPLRQYMALDGDVPAGWLQSIVAGDSAWCSSVYVKPEYRRRGIARAMLARMLSDDRASGARASVLLASHTGAKLYPVVGYEQIGELLLYTPPRS